MLQLEISATRMGVPLTKEEYVSAEFLYLVYNCAHSRSMSYQWDANKASANLRKHAVDFADAVSAFADALAITIEDKRFDEERFILMGLDALGRVLVVVYTHRGEDIRIISARKANRFERQQYLEG